MATQGDACLRLLRQINDKLSYINDKLSYVVVLLISLLMATCAR